MRLMSLSARGRVYSLMLGAILLILLAWISLSVGSMELTLSKTWQALWTYDETDANALIVQDIRLPRILLGVLVGAALGVAGAAMQGLFRNPLADPGLIGVSSGSALAAVTVIVLGGSYFSDWVALWGFYALPVAAFLGGALVTFLIYRIASSQGRTDVGLMLLAGIAINALAGSLTGILTYFASNEELRSLTFWTMGSFASASWSEVKLAVFPVLLALVGLPFFARALNAFLLGENVAFHMGFNLKRLKLAVIGFTALAVGTAVAVSGMIAFVGLVAPHLVRLVVGPDHRAVLMGSAFTGAMLVLVSDMLARTLLAPAEVPIGLLMAALGAPFFLGMLLHRRNRVGF